MTEDRTPDGFWKLENVYTNGYQIVVLGVPPQDSELEGPPYHNCDEMGCGSLDHVIAKLPIMYPTPELEWAKTRQTLRCSAPAANFVTFPIENNS